MATSRRFDRSVFRPYPFGPPFHGFRHTIPPLSGTSLPNVEAKGETPFYPSPYLHEVESIRLYPELLSSMEGTVEHVASTNPTLIWTYDDGTNRDILVIDNNAGTARLRYVANAGSAATLVSNIGTFTARRGSQVPFFNRNIFTAPDQTLWWYDGATRTARAVGVAVPATNLAAAAGAAGVPNGAYLYVYTNVNDQGHESSPSAASTVVNPVNQQVDLTSIDVGPTGTTSRKIYRTTAGGTTYLFNQTIADNVTTTATDNLADSALGSAVVTDNTVPPTAIQFVTATSNRIALLSTDGVTVQFCKVDPATGQPNWEAYPTALSIQIPFSGGVDKARALAFWRDDLYVLGYLNTYRLVGDIATGLKVEKILPGVGIFWNFSFCVLEQRGLVLFTPTKKLLLWDGGSLKDIGTNAQSVLGYTAAATNQIGPHINYDPSHDCLYFEAVSKIRDIQPPLIYSFRAEEWSAGNTAANNSYYSSHFNNYYIETGGFIRSRFLGVTYPTSALAYVNAALLRYQPWTPLPGFDIDFGWIELIVSAQAISAGAVPMLKVQWALNGTEQFTEKWIDISRDFLTSSTVSENPVIRAVRVPIHQVGKSITVRVDIPTSAQISVGVSTSCDIYGINLWCRPLREARDLPSH